MLSGFEAGLREIWRHAPKATIQAILSTCDEVFQQYEIDTPLRVAHFMAQISHECGCGTIVRENMSYSAKRITEVFGFNKKRNRWVHSARVTDEEAEELAHRPKALAERVYGLGNPKKAQELGNLVEGDAYRYRGNGMLQLTGAGAHKRVAEMTGFPLYEQPQMLEDPAKSFMVAAAEFYALKARGSTPLKAADADDVELVTLIVNGGRNGIAERTVYLKQWKTYLDDIETPVQLPRTVEEPPAKKLSQSRIIQGGTVGTVAATVTAATTVSDAIKQVSDASDTVKTVADQGKNIADNAGAVVTTVKPLLGLPVSTIITAVLALVAVGCFVYVLLERYKKLRDQGV